jgi:Ni/Fe-hydrogenase subunit HybB-like protein
MSATNSTSKGRHAVPVITIILAAIAALGVVLGIIRLVKGLGPTTNLNDGYPWGLWIAFDFFAVPFSAGAFTLALVSQIFNRKEYHGIAHLALLAGFLGYTMVVLVLLLDIGRWDQFYSVLLPWRWNLHSFMFEVSMSITFYFGVLILELLPIVFAKKADWLPVQIVNQLMVLLASVGILLSTVHQGSIGAIFLILSHKLHALWWTPILPLLFLTSALFSGLSVAIFFAVLTWRALKRPVPMKLLSDLVKVVVVVQAVYLVLKLGDLLLAGELGLVFDSGGFSLIWLAEMIIGVIAPMAIFASRARESESGLLVGTICVAVGLAINRSTQAWFALEAPPGTTYTPHWIEWAIVIAALAAGILIFSLGVRFVEALRKPVLEEGH